MCTLRGYAPGGLLAGYPPLGSIVADDGARSAVSAPVLGLIFCHSQSPLLPDFREFPLRTGPRMKSYMGLSVAPEYRTVSNRPLFRPHRSTSASITHGDEDRECILEFERAFSATPLHLFSLFFINFLNLLPFSITDVRNCWIFPMNFLICILLAILTYAMVSNS